MTTPVALLTLVIWVVLTVALVLAANTNRAHVVLAQVIKIKMKHYRIDWSNVSLRKFGA